MDGLQGKWIARAAAISEISPLISAKGEASYDPTEPGIEEKGLLAGLI